MIRHILTVSTGTLASRTLGFTRDALIAYMAQGGSPSGSNVVPATCTSSQATTR